MIRRLAIKAAMLACLLFLFWAIAWIDREVGSGVILADMLGLRVETLLAA